MNVYVISSCLGQFTYIENERHIIKIELVLLLVVLLKLSSVVVLTLLRYVCSHMSLLFGLEPHIQHTGSPSASNSPLGITNHGKQSLKCRCYPLCYLFNIRLCGIDILISLLCVLCCTLRFSPFSFKALFTLECREERWSPCSVHSAK